MAPTLELMLMDVETLREYREHGQPLSKGYDKLLKELLEDGGMLCFVMYWSYAG